MSLSYGGGREKVSSQDPKTPAGAERQERGSPDDATLRLPTRDQRHQRSPRLRLEAYHVETVCGKVACVSDSAHSGEDERGEPGVWETYQRSKQASPS